MINSIVLHCTIRDVDCSSVFGLELGTANTTASHESHVPLHNGAFHERVPPPIIHSPSDKCRSALEDRGCDCQLSAIV